jgi:putative SOS response-associated peptidase YedK
MCGRLNTTFDRGMKTLYTSLNIHKVIDKPIDSRFVKAADTVSIVRNVGEQRRVEKATWWLLLDQTDNDFKPSRYTSFNTRYDKLNISGSAGYQAYRSSRCIIAVKGFGETEFSNKKPLHYFDMEAASGGLMLGGLCREWQHQTTGEIKLSCSVITLPPHEKLKHIHSKAMPLLLPQGSSLIDQWLSPQVNEVEQFDSLLIPKIPQTLIANRIDKPMTHQIIAKSQTINRD